MTNLNKKGIEKVLVNGVTYSLVLGTVLSTGITAKANSGEQANVKEESIEVVTGINVKYKGDLIAFYDVNGEEVNPFVEQTNVGGVTYLPVRALAELLGFNVVWNDELKRVEIYTANNPASIYVVDGPLEELSEIKEINVTTGYPILIDGKVLADENGEAIHAYAYNGSTQLPLRVIAEALGMNIVYNYEENVIYISKKTIENPTPAKEFPNASDEFNQLVSDARKAIEFIKANNEEILALKEKSSDMYTLVLELLSVTSEMVQETGDTGVYNHFVETVRNPLSEDMSFLTIGVRMYFSANIPLIELTLNKIPADFDDRKEKFPNEFVLTIASNVIHDYDDLMEFTDPSNAALLVKEWFRLDEETYRVAGRFFPVEHYLTGDMLNLIDRVTGGDLPSISSTDKTLVLN